MYVCMYVLTMYVMYACMRYVCVRGVCMYARPPRRTSCKAIASDNVAYLFGRLHVVQGSEHADGLPEAVVLGNRGLLPPRHVILNDRALS